MSAKAMGFDELMDSLKEVGSDGTSALAMRSETIQTKEKKARVKSLKKEAKKKAKLLIIRELAIPFNPITGKPDETYNFERKYRPSKSATTVAKALKQLCDTNEDSKKEFMRRVGVTEWDTSNYEELNDLDFKVFVKYSVPRIFTLPTVNINIPALRKYDGGQNYIIDVKRDENENIIGEVPLVLRAYYYFADLAYESVKEYDEKVARGETTKSDKLRQTAMQEIYGKIPVSSDKPSNYAMAHELKLTNNYELDRDVNLGSYSPEEIWDGMVRFSRNKKIRVALEKYTGGDWSSYDGVSNFDFYEIDMACPTSAENDAELGMDTTYEKPSNKLRELPGFTNFLSALDEKLDELVNIEEIMLRSIKMPKYDQKIEDQLAACLPSVIDLADARLTNTIILKHENFLSEILGDKADDLIMSAKEEDGTYIQGTDTTEEARKAAKDFNLNETMAEAFETPDDDDADDAEVTELK